MKNLKKISLLKKDKKLMSTSLNKEDQKAVKGGFLFKLVDDVRCDLERRTSIFFGGNGDGDW